MTWESCKPNRSGDVNDRDGRERIIFSTELLLKLVKILGSTELVGKARAHLAIRVNQGDWSGDAHIGTCRDSLAWNKVLAQCICLFVHPRWMVWTGDR